MRDSAHAHRGTRPGLDPVAHRCGDIVRRHVRLGLAIVPGEFRWVVQRPVLLLKALFAVLVAVPVLALVVTRALELPRAVDIGIVLMAISPGAPVALRRSMGAGGHQTFAPALQIAVALLAVVSMPLSIAVLNEYYRGQAVVDPQHLARQVFFAQLLPLALGMAMNRLRTEPPRGSNRGSVGSEACCWSCSLCWC